MYKNLLEILNKKKITMKAYAEFLGVSEKTLYNKMNGKTEFTLAEAIKTCNIVCPEYRMDYVFEEESVMGARKNAGVQTVAIA